MAGPSASPPALRLAAVTFAYRHSPIFDRFHLTVSEGEMIGILGPNGTGKTTLLRLAAGSLRPGSGAVEVRGSDLATIGPRARARTIGVVPQENHLVHDFSVEEVVLMGRGPHLGLLGLEGPRDREIAHAVMTRTNVLDLAKRPFRTLSGGERQRVVVARALAQQPLILLLDEPTAFLDLRHQVAIYALLEKLNRESGLTVVVASHDVNLAARHCRRLILLHEGRIYADGPPAEVLRVETFRTVFGVDVEVRADPSTGVPHVVPVAAIGAIGPGT